MVPQNSKLSERLAVLASSLPVTASTAGGTLTTSAVNIAGTNANFFGRYLAIATINSTNVATITLVKASDSALTSATAIATQTNSSTSTPVVLMDLNGTTQALSDTLNTYIALRIINTSATGAMEGLILGSDGRYDPAQTWNYSGVNTNIPSV